MHDSNLITSISFLIGDRRASFNVNQYGRFEVYRRDPVRGVDVYIGTKTAKELIDWVITGDPVLTLKDGYKMRVCQGGSTDIRVEALCLIEGHDSHHLKQLVVWNSQ